MNSTLLSALNITFDLTHGIRPCACPPDAQTTIGRLIIGHTATCERAKARTFTWWLDNTERHGTLSDYADDWEEAQYGRAAYVSEFVYTDTSTEKVTVVADAAESGEWQVYALTVRDQAALGALDRTALPPVREDTDEHAAEQLDERALDFSDLLHTLRLQQNAHYGSQPGAFSDGARLTNPMRLDLIEVPLMRIR